MVHTRFMATIITALQCVCTHYYPYSTKSVVCKLAKNFFYKVNN